MSMHGEGKRTWPALFVEVVLISLGVFLGLWANSWHEEREQRALAESTLRNFATEMQTNERAVKAVRPYHEELVRELETVLHTRQPLTQEQFQAGVHFTGIHPVTFERTAWDLALATHALSYLKPGLAFDISKVYTKQNSFQTLENDFISAVYSPATFSNDNAKGFATAIRLYLGDANVQEPDLLALYQEVLPEIRKAAP